MGWSHHFPYTIQMLTHAPRVPVILKCTWNLVDSRNDQWRARSLFPQKAIKKRFFDRTSFHSSSVTLPELLRQRDKSLSYLARDEFVANLLFSVIVFVEFEPLAGSISISDQNRMELTLVYLRIPAQICWIWTYLANFTNISLIILKYFSGKKKMFDGQNPKNPGIRRDKFLLKVRVIRKSKFRLELG